MNQRYGWFNTIFCSDTPKEKKKDEEEEEIKRNEA